MVLYRCGLKTNPLVGVGLTPVNSTVCQSNNCNNNKKTFRMRYQDMHAEFKSEESISQ